MTKKLFVKNIHIKELNNLKMEATPITAEHKILQAEYYRQQKRDLAIDNIIERINIGEFVESHLKIKSNVELINIGSKICTKIQQSNKVCKGKYLQLTGQLVMYVHNELKKGRCRASLLIELI